MSPTAPAISEVVALREGLYRLFSACLLGAPTGWVGAAFRDPEWLAALGRLLDYPISDVSPNLLEEDGLEALPPSMPPCSWCLPARRFRLSRHMSRGLNRPHE